MEAIRAARPEVRLRRPIWMNDSDLPKGGNEDGVLVLPDLQLVDKIVDGRNILLLPRLRRGLHNKRVKHQCDSLRALDLGRRMNQCHDRAREQVH